jgi:hypothetical protein
MHMSWSLLDLIVVEAGSADVRGVGAKPFA